MADIDVNITLHLTPEELKNLRYLLQNTDYLLGLIEGHLDKSLLPFDTWATSQRMNINNLKELKEKIFKLIGIL